MISVQYWTIGLIGISVSLREGFLLDLINGGVFGSSRVLKVLCNGFTNGFHQQLFGILIDRKTKDAGQIKAFDMRVGAIRPIKVFGTFSRPKILCICAVFQAMTLLSINANNTVNKWKVDCRLLDSPAWNRQFRCGPLERLHDGKVAYDVAFEILAETFKRALQRRHGAKGISWSRHRG